MSQLKIKVVRELRYTQYTNQGTDSGVSEFEAHTGQYYELVTGPWPTGSRVRQKRFATTDALKAYLNKLLNGGWIEVEDYDELYSVTEALVLRNAMGLWKLDR